MEKMQWIVPELIVIARNSPEEAVLTVCKIAAQTGPTYIYAVCSTACPPAGVCSGVGSA